MRVALAVVGRRMNPMQQYALVVQVRRIKAAMAATVLQTFLVAVAVALGRLAEMPQI
jgi:hypothetical protein